MMNIMMAANSDVYNGVELVVYSTMTHNKNINWYIFTMDLAVGTHDGTIIYRGLFPEHKKKLYDIVKYFDVNSNIVFIDSYDFYSEHLTGSVNELTNFTPYASLRLIADLALPHVTDLLYLDCDTAVCSNLESMYFNCKSDVSEYAYAVYADEACDGDGEMVSGVMFLNLRKIREDGFLERARKNYMENLYRFPDQMALRDSGKIAKLSPLYGYMWDHRKTGATPAIVHFTHEYPCKIYSQEINKATFYRMFPEFAYVKEGCELLEKILFTERRENLDLNH